MVRRDRRIDGDSPPHFVRAAPGYTNKVRSAVFPARYACRPPTPQPCRPFSARRDSFMSNSSISTHTICRLWTTVRRVGKCRWRWSARWRRSGSASSTRPRTSAAACSCRRARRSTPRSPPCRPTWRRRGPPYAWAWAPRTSGTMCSTAGMRDRTIPVYGSGPAFLFEVHPQFMPTGLENELFQLRVAGLLPVMAHPERYVGDPARRGSGGAPRAPRRDDGRSGRARRRARARGDEDGAQAGAGRAGARGGNRHSSPRRSERDRRRDGVDPQAARRRGAGTDAGGEHAPAARRRDAGRAAGVRRDYFSSDERARPLRRSRLP